jgi:uncharacterized membrane protein YhfC
MRSAILLTGQTLMVVLGVLLLGWWLHWQRAARPSTWGWGALAFVASQAVRLPLLIGITIAAGPYFTDLDPEIAFWINFAILTTTSGLFEETARYVVLRYAARDARRWRDGVMFGAGHGGIEAILIFGFGLFSSLTLLLTGDALVAQLQATAPDQVGALQAQIDTVRNLEPWTLLLGIWERVLAITLHIALSLLVLRTVRDRHWIWWLVAAVWHAAFNGTALLVVRYAGIWQAEAALTLLSALSVYVIVRTRRDDGTPVADEGAR